MKTCKSCNINKSVEEFHKYAKQPDGIDYYCKECRHSKNVKSWNGKKPTCEIEDCNNLSYARKLCRMHYGRVLRTGSTERKNEIYPISKRYKTSNGYTISGDKLRASRIRYTYGLSLEEYESRAAKGCECCGAKPEYALHVDHDHACCNSQVSCGRCVRGIVCARCNVSISKMEQGTLNVFHPYYSYIKQYLAKYAKIV